MARRDQQGAEPVAKPLELDLSHKPHVILVVGVNGTGKTTTIGKLAASFGAAGKVMMAAGDTFRAAAIEQLQDLGRAHRRGGHRPARRGADAAGLAFDALTEAKAGEAAATC